MIMKPVQGLFLEALKASLTGEKITWAEPFPEQGWLELFRMAELHHVLPMIYEAVWDCPAAQAMRPEFLAPFKKKTVHQVMLQAMKTDEFLRLYQKLSQEGLKILVVKGIVCRELYPKPDYRLSGDEDILVGPDQAARCHEVMLGYGMKLLEPDKDIGSVYEAPYGKQGSPLYIEMHKSLFPPESDAYGDFNRFFVHAFERKTALAVGGASVYTLEPTDHLFYLICHAFKHFLHCGFGIRQVCDITLFANAYGKEIDWLSVLGRCREIHAEQFTAALFEIGRKYLTFAEEEACYPREWKEILVDEKDLLEDLLAGGVYGASDMSRQHSSNITLNAVSARKKGRKIKGTVLKTVFPSAKNLEGRYPYLRKYPFLLPAAWVSRILKYRRETAGAGDGEAAASIRIGNQRVELLKKYGILL